MIKEDIQQSLLKHLAKLKGISKFTKRQCVVCPSLSRNSLYQRIHRIKREKVMTVLMIRALPNLLDKEFQELQEVILGHLEKELFQKDWRCKQCFSAL